MIAMRAISKRFGSTEALDAVDFSIEKGRAHALLGENGAGKTTLMRVLYGMVEPDYGQIVINGKTVVIDSPKSAAKLGIGMVHQHFMLAPNLTVAENVILGSPLAPPLISRRKAASLVTPAMEDYSIWLDPMSLVADLTVGQRQKVEILKTLFRKARLLILDEPTAVLAPHEVDQLFLTVKRLKEEGRSVVFISHKLREITSVCDDITVLRSGRRVGHLAASKASHDDLALMMTGTKVAKPKPRATRTESKPVLEVERLTVPSSEGSYGVKNATFAVSSGEIVGIAGVDGNGQTALAEALCGLRSVESGSAWVDSTEVSGRSPGQIFAQGVALIPNDRHSEALVLDLSLTDNLILKHHGDSRFNWMGILKKKMIRRRARSLTTAYDIRANSLRAPVSDLSGGNQQKAVAAREFSDQPRLVIAMNPARGLDVAATRFLFDQLIEQRNKGTAVLLICADLDELMQVSDRIMAIYEGDLIETDWPDSDRQTIGRQMLGVQPELWRRMTKDAPDSPPENQQEADLAS
jgi:simple sugar transport system ATP-binding protein